MDYIQDLRSIESCDKIYRRLNKLSTDSADYTDLLIAYPAH